VLRLNRLRLADQMLGRAGDVGARLRTRTALVLADVLLARELFPYHAPDDWLRRIAASFPGASPSDQRAAIERLQDLAWPLASSSRAHGEPAGALLALELPAWKQCLGVRAPLGDAVWDHVLGSARRAELAFRPAPLRLLGRAGRGLMDAPERTWCELDAAIGRDPGASEPYIRRALVYLELVASRAPVRAADLDVARALLAPALDGGGAIDARALAAVATVDVWLALTTRSGLVWGALDVLDPIARLAPGDLRLALHVTRLRLLGHSLVPDDPGRDLARARQVFARWLTAEAVERLDERRLAGTTRLLDLAFALRSGARHRLWFAAASGPRTADRLRSRLDACGVDPASGGSIFRR
jgi:hypothetical protein